MLAKRFLFFFLKPQNTFLSATLVVMSMMLFSRILGLVRYRLLAHFFGGDITLLDSFIAATLIPEGIFDIFIFGTISIAFIPVLSSLLAQKKEEDGWRLVTTLLVSGMVIFLIVSLAVFIFAEQVALVVAPGIIAKNEQARATIANLIRIMLVAQIFFVPGTILTGVFQTFRYFFIPALAPVLYNVGTILGIVFLSENFSIYAPAYGMVLGAILFLIVQLPLARNIGMKLTLHNLFFSGAWRVLSLSFPRTITLVASRINDALNIIFASLLAPGAIVAFNFAQTLQLAPVGIFGASMAQAILPTFSIIYGKKDLVLFKQVFLSTFHQLLFIILPLSAILAVLRIPIVRLIYGASSFPWETTVLTGQILIIFSLSLFAQVLNLLLSRAFYAMHDAKTPLVVTLTSIIINISLSIFFILIKGFPVHFLAFSFTAASIFQAIFLFLLLAKKLGGFKLTEIISSSVKIAIASLLMAVALYIPMKLLDQLVFDTTRTVPLILLTGTAGLSGLLVYAFFAWLFRIGQLTPVLSLLRRFGKIPKAREEVEVINGGARTNP